VARTILAVLVVGAIAIGGFFFWVGGGFDLFKQPIEIIIPAGYSGAVCAKLLQGHELSRYEVEPSGLLRIDEETIRTHRKLRFLSKSPGSGASMPLPNDAMFPIFSETDLPNNATYTVFWVGTPSSWSQFNGSRSRAPLCIGRF